MLSCDGATYVCVPACLLHHLQARCGHVMRLHMLQVLFAVIQALNTLTRVGDCVSDSLLFAKRHCLNLLALSWELQSKSRTLKFPLS
jgi:hypothetical protein